MMDDRIAPVGQISCCPVIACDKRKAFAQGSACDEAIQLSLTFHKSWIASLRSQ
jgi:hypothetical protein